MKIKKRKCSYILLSNSKEGNNSTRKINEENFVEYTKENHDRRWLDVHNDRKVNKSFFLTSFQHELPTSQILHSLTKYCTENTSN